jgi:hypothetical protein
MVAFQSSPLVAELATLSESGDGSAFDSDAKRQHFVPQLILRGFSTERDGKRWLYQLNTKSGKSLRTSAEAAASRRYFYAVKNEDGSRNNRLEGWFARIESHAALALDSFLADPLALSSGDRATLSFFLAIQTQRTPSDIATTEETANVVLRMLVGTESFSDPVAFQNTYRELFGDNRSPAEIEEFRKATIRSVREGRVRMVDPGGAAVASGLKIAPDQALTIYQMGWTLLRSDAGFVTSDRGFAMHDPTPVYPWSANGLLSSARAQTTIPLNDSACLLLSPEGDGVTFEDVTADVVTRLNLRTYGWASEYIFGTGQPLVTGVRAAAKARPSYVVRPKPHRHVMMIDPDPEDDSLAMANQRRGWPPRLVYEGVAHDYVVVPSDTPSPEIQALADRVVEERTRKSLGLAEGVRPPGRISTNMIHPWDLSLADEQK